MLITVEEGIKQALTKAFGNSVRTIETHPGRWGNEVIGRMLASAPALYVGFSQGTYLDLGQDQINSRWHVYAVAESLNSRRKIGAYQLMERALVCLHELDLDQNDVLRFKQVKNLFSFAQDKQGFCCYELVFELPIALPMSADLVDYQPNHQSAPGSNGQGNDLSQNSVDPWESYEATHLDDNDQVLAVDVVEIPQTNNGET